MHALLNIWTLYIKHQNVVSVVNDTKQQTGTVNNFTLQKY